MKTWKRTPSLMLLLVLALLTLLPLLALLQYHWLGEVTKGEREIMKSNLQTGAAQFGQDFDREVRNAFLHFQSGLEHVDDQLESVLSKSYRRWQETAARPRLIGEIYQAKVNDRGAYDLMKFVPASNRFEPGEWSERLRDFSGIIERQRKAHESMRRDFQSSRSQNGPLRGEKRVNRAFIQVLMWPIDQQIPGLIIPLVSFKTLRQKIENDLPLPRAYCIVTFDLDYIKREFIPELVDRYFSTGGRRDYYVAVERQDSQQIIYQSDADLPADIFRNSDVSENFFKARINDDRVMFTGWFGRTGGRVEAPPPGKRLTFSVHEGRVAYGRAERVAEIGEKPRLFSKANSEGYWRIAVKHRSGSLEAAVAGARRRNLAISFGILLLLGVSIGLIVLSSRRAQRLAIQQMEFVTGVSHELRTPLAVICSAAENLADGVIDNRGQIKQYGGLIRDEGRRLAEMVEQVLEFAGVQSERRRYELRPTDLNAVIENALAACHLQMLEGGFEIEKRAAADLPLVSADAAALSRAIQNLLGNAMKYSGQSRWLGLGVEVVNTQSGREVQIKVSDRGLGISPSELSHIFEPFYRGREVIDAQIHGNGLGLSLVRHIIETHGGQASVESRPGQGTSFTLRIPVMPSDRSSIYPSIKEYEQAHLAD